MKFEGPTSTVSFQAIFKSRTKLAEKKQNPCVRSFNKLLEKMILKEK